VIYEPGPKRASKGDYPFGNIVTTQAQEPGVAAFSSRAAEGIEKKCGVCQASMDEKIIEIPVQQVREKRKISSKYKWRKRGQWVGRERWLGGKRLEEAAGGE